MKPSVCQSWPLQIPHSCPVLLPRIIKPNGNSADGSRTRWTKSSQQLLTVPITSPLGGNQEPDLGSGLLYSAPVGGAGGLMGSQPQWPQIEQQRCSCRKAGGVPPNSCNPVQGQQRANRNWGGGGQQTSSASVLNLMVRQTDRLTNIPRLSKKTLHVSGEKMLEIVEVAGEPASRPVAPPPLENLSEAGRTVWRICWEADHDLLARGPCFGFFFYIYF